MSIQSSMDAIKQSSKSVARITHQNDSDEQLREVFLTNARLIAGLSNSMNDIAEGYRLMGESEACSEILSERQSRREQIKKKKEEWKKGLPVRKERAVLQIPTAVSPNGQLVAAILEDEDGKTAEELSGWCDELGSLDEQELEKLLGGLEKEGVVKRDSDGQYHLRRLCTEDLLPDADTAIGEIGALYDEKEKANARLIVRMMLDEAVPLCVQDCLDLLGSYQRLAVSDARYREADLAMSEFDARWSIGKMRDAGLVSRQYSADGKDYYWFTLPGEGRN